MKKNTVQAQQWLEKCYGDSARSKKTICRWYAEFKRGRTDTEYAERSGRPNEVVTPEAIKKVHQFVYEEAVVKVYYYTLLLHNIKKIKMAGSTAQSESIRTR